MINKWLYQNVYKIYLFVIERNQFSSNKEEAGKWEKKNNFVGHIRSALTADAILYDFKTPFAQF